MLQQSRPSGLLQYDLAVPARGSSGHCHKVLKLSRLKRLLFLIVRGIFKASIYFSWIVKNTLIQSVNLNEKNEKKTKTPFRAGGCTHTHRRTLVCFIWIFVLILSQILFTVKETDSPEIYPFHKKQFCPDPPIPFPTFHPHFISSANAAAFTYLHSSVREKGLKSCLYTMRSGSRVGDAFRVQGVCVRASVPGVCVISWLWHVWVWTNMCSSYDRCFFFTCFQTGTCWTCWTCWTCMSGQL